MNLKGFKPTYILPDRYLVKEYGDVYSIRSKKFISKRLDRYGYLRVNLYEGTKIHTVPVHRLVAKAFIPNPYNLPEVNHIDGNKLNNHVSNLEWVSSSQNQIHAFLLGLQKPKRGEQNPSAKYSEKDVILVCELLNKGFGNAEIRDITGYSIAFVEKIKYGECWTHITKKYGIIPKAKRATTRAYARTLQAVGSGNGGHPR